MLYAGKEAFSCGSGSRKWYWEVGRAPFIKDIGILAKERPFISKVVEK